MIRTAQDLIDEIENQLGDHDPSEVPVDVAVAKPGGMDSHIGMSLTGLEHFNGVLTLHVE